MKLNDSLSRLIEWRGVCQINHHYDSQSNFRFRDDCDEPTLQEKTHRE